VLFSWLCAAAVMRCCWPSSSNLRHGWKTLARWDGGLTTECTALVHNKEEGNLAVSKV
jgi:hypothetical protein